MSCGTPPFNPATALPGNAFEACQEANLVANCNLEIGVVGYERERGENLFCYYLRLFELILAGGVGGAVVPVSAPPPASPTEGSLWFDEISRQLMVYNELGVWEVANTGGGGGGGGVASVTASSPLASSGGANPNISLGAAVPLTLGGTGASDAASARTNLGLGTMAVQNANGVAITGGSVEATNFVPGSATPRLLSSRFGEVVNVRDYGAVGNGVTDDTAAVAAAVAASRAGGPIVGLKLSSPVAGYTVPDPVPATAWAARPAVAAVGGLGSGFAAVGNIDPDGYLVGFEVTNVGSGYDTLAILVNRTSGTDTITRADGGVFDVRLVAGVSVRHESLDNGVTIIARSLDGLTLTISQLNTFTNQDVFVFGLPWFTVAGTPNYDGISPVLGAPKTLHFPAGVYAVSTLGVFAGMSNLTVDARSATFRVTALSFGAWLRFCHSVTWLGGKFLFTAAKFEDPALRVRYPGQHGVIVAASSHVVFFGTELWDSLDFGFSIGGGESTAGVWATDVNFFEVTVGNGLGDGIHYTTGSRMSRVSGATILHPRDDALAVVNDSTSAPKTPYGITFEDCRVDGGIYRGCVVIGADDVVFKNIRGTGTHGPFCWANPAGPGLNPNSIAFIGITGLNLGDTALSASDTNSGIGIFAEDVDKLVLRDLTFTQHPSVVGLGNPRYVVNEGLITEFDSDNQFIESTGGTNTFTGAVDADLNCTAGDGFAQIALPPGRWLVQGTIAARSSTASAGAFYPVFVDGVTEYGRGATQQVGADGATRHQLTCHAVIDTQVGIAGLFFRVKNGGGGFTIDAGSTFGPNSHIVATRLA